MRTKEVFVFVRRGAQVLVLRRSERQGGYWHGVAGGVEEGETWREAAARELVEETGLAVELRDLEQPYVYDSVTVHTFVADAPPGWEPVLDWEHDEYRWCDTAAALELLYWPEPRDVLRSMR